MLSYTVLQIVIYFLSRLHCFFTPNESLEWRSIWQHYTWNSVAGLGRFEGEWVKWVSAGLREKGLIVLFQKQNFKGSIITEIFFCLGNKMIFITYFYYKKKERILHLNIEVALKNLKLNLFLTIFCICPGSL